MQTRGKFILYICIGIHFTYFTIYNLRVICVSNMYTVGCSELGRLNSGRVVSNMATLVEEESKGSRQFKIRLCIALPKRRGHTKSPLCDEDDHDGARAAAGRGEGQAAVLYAARGGGAQPRPCNIGRSVASDNNDDKAAHSICLVAQDCWVSINHRVLDVSELVQENLGERVTSRTPCKVIDIVSDT